VKVRFATEKDIPVYLEYLKLFHEQAPIKNYIKLDEEGLQSFLENNLSNPSVGIFLCEEENKIVGITGGIYYPMYFNPNAFVVQELWWWVHPDARGKGASKFLLNSLETWAKLKNAAAIFMIALEDKDVDTVSSIYRKNNYEGLERIFIKELM
jgi:GNAT superfamily N-acetyltransferase